MYRFRLLGGQHIEADKSRPIKGADGKPTGRFEKRTYNAGDVITTETNLAEKLGPNKFELLGGDGPGSDAERVAELERELAELKATHGVTRTPGDPTPENLKNSPAVAPGGQVSTGWQGADSKEHAERQHGQQTAPDANPKLAPRPAPHGRK